jgi:hypothetical protein
MLIFSSVNSYNVMLQCWDPDSKQRPAFPDLVVMIRKVIDHMERMHTPVGTVSYINVPTSQDYLYPLNPQYDMSDEGGLYEEGGYPQTYTLSRVNETQSERLLQSQSTLV